MEQPGLTRECSGISPCLCSTAHSPGVRGGDGWVMALQVAGHGSHTLVARGDEGLYLPCACCGGLEMPSSMFDLRAFCSAGQSGFESPGFVC